MTSQRHLRLEFFNYFILTQLATMAYVVTHFHVLNRKIKSKFSHFVIKKIPRFKLPEELGSFLLAKHPAIVRPAEDINTVRNVKFSGPHIIENGPGDVWYSVVFVLLMHV